MAFLGRDRRKDQKRLDSARKVQSELDFFIHQCMPLTKSREIAIDGGANIGAYARAMAPFFKWVYAYEPNNKVFQKMLMHNAQANLHMKIIGRPMALMDEIGKGVLTNPADKTTASAGYIVKNLEGEVEVTTIDAQFMHTPASLPVGLIKLDLEGAELMALKGGERLIKRDRPVLFVEYSKLTKTHYEQRTDDAHRWMTNNGYVMWREHECNRIYVPI